MRRHPKASAVRSTVDVGSKTARATPVAATRGAFGDVDGSGAPSRSRALLALFAAGLLCLLLAPSAFGAQTRLPIQTVGADGNSPGTKFGDPRSLAFDQVSKRLYALDIAPARIYGFDASTPGIFTPLVAPFPLTGLTTPGASPDIAVDGTGLSSAGRIYYAATNGANGTVSAFNPNGTAVGSPYPISPPPSKTLAGAAVAPDGTLFVANANLNASTGKRIFRYDPTGTALSPLDMGTVGNGRPTDLAFDSNGDLYMALSNLTGPSGVYRLTAASGYDQASATPIVTTTTTDYPRAIAVDASTHVLYILRQSSATSAAVTAYDAPSGNPLYGFGNPSANYRGIAVDQSTDRVFLSSPTSQALQVFGPATVVLDATGTPQAATSVTATSAVLNATIDDNGAAATRWRFQISKDGVTWTDTGTAGATAGGQTGAAVSVSATGLTHNSTYHFRIVTNKSGLPSDDVPSSSLTFQTQTIPNASVVLDPASNVTSTSADLKGTVTDNGPLPTSWKIELSGDGGASWSTVSSGATSGGQSGVIVSGTAGGLLPNQDYKFRIITSKGPGSDGDIVHGPLDFKTVAVVPVIANVGAISPDDTSARVAGSIDPRNSGNLDYVFEYGTTPSLGSATAPVTVSNGSSPVIVSQEISGLSPNTTYYLRLAATNATGTGLSPIVEFTTRAEPLPQATDRAYEMVSPAEKNGGAALSGYSVAHVSFDGEAVGYCTTSLFGDPPAQQSWICGDYVSRRGDTGWTTKATNPRFCRNDSDDTFNAAGAKQTVYFSRSFDQAVIGQPENASADCSIAPLDPSAPLPQRNFYLENLTGASPGYQLLAPAPSPASYLPGSGLSQLYGASYAGSSDDFSHIVYRASGQQTVDSPAGTVERIFEWDEGTLRLVSKDVAGNTLSGPTKVPEDGVNGVSSNGERIFFQNPAEGFGECNQPTCEIYLREGGTSTYDVSESECTSACGASAGDRFLFASQDGSRVLFKSAAKLTDDDNSTAAFDASSGSGADLFLYTHSVAPVSDTNLTLLSRDNEPADGVNADVQDVIGISDDAKVVYFAANGQIVAGQPTAAGPKIYRWSFNGGSPTIEYLATLAASDASQNWVVQANGLESRLVTPDGNYLLTVTNVALDPVADTDTTLDQYRWGATDGWVCTSCQAPGVPSQGDVPGAYFASALGLELPRSTQRRIVMSNDGQRIFFQTTDPLVPEDTNGAAGCANPVTVGFPAALPCSDVYEWHEGTVSLLTGGTTQFEAPVVLIGASEEGRDVFLYTSQRMVGWDTDDAGDIYDARIGGGFPEPPPTGAPCEGEACRNAGSPPPNTTGAGSAAFEGPGNPPPGKAKPRRCPAGKHKVTKKGKTRCVKSKKKKRNAAKKRDANHNRRTAR